VQAVAAAKLARDRDYQKTAVIYVNNDYGVNMAKEFEAAFAGFGGAVSAMVPYNESQTSYRAEVNQAMGAEPDSLFFISYPADGATLMREWFSFGGTDNLVLSNALRADEFVNAIGARFLTKAVGIDNAQVEHPSVEAFNREFEAKFGKPPQGPGLHLVYDAVAVTLLAAQAAETVTGLTIRDNIRVITSPDGVEGLTQALNLIKQGETIRYVGATGPLQFDENGDVAGPVLVWGVDEGALVEQDVMTIDDMNALFAELENK
jgi:branched-chain amino acid transport system substrate-binding protein